MKFNLPKIKLSAQNIALLSLATITFASWFGLGLSMKSKAEGEGLTPVQWVLLIQGSIAYAGFLGMLNDGIEKPDSLIEKLEDGRGSRIEDLQAQTHIVLDAEFDENLTNITQNLEEMVQGVSAVDEQLIRLARVNTTILEEPLESKAKVEQTPFRPFRCCFKCKYINKYHSSCAVVPFGCTKADSSELCRDFESKDSYLCSHLIFGDTSF